MRSTISFQVGSGSLRGAHFRGEKREFLYIMFEDKPRYQGLVDAGILVRFKVYKRLLRETPMNGIALDPEISLCAYIPHVSTSKEVRAPRERIAYFLLVPFDLPRMQGSHLRNFSAVQAGTVGWKCSQLKLLILHAT